VKEKENQRVAASIETMHLRLLMEGFKKLIIQRVAFFFIYVNP
jgi:hypothetical protein